jgi:hypothetical protein
VYRFDDPLPPEPLCVGQRVRVLPGTRDPDFPTLCLDGWTGTVREVDADTPPLCLIEWDDTTFAAIPDSVVEQAEHTGMEVRSIWLNPSALAPIGPPVGAGPLPPARVDDVDQSPDSWAVWRSLSLATIYCAGAGAVLGAVVAAVPGGLSGLTIGSVVLAIAGYLTGSSTARWFRASHPVVSTPALASFLGLVIGGLVGGVLGTMTAAVLGAVPGCIAGSLLNRLSELVRWRLLGHVTWVVLGGFVGAAVLALVTDLNLALEGATAGGLLGAGAGLVLVLLALVGTALSARQTG